jgi:hypothetical protein
MCIFISHAVWKPKIYLTRAFGYLIYILIYEIKSTKSLWTNEGNETLTWKVTLTLDNESDSIDLITP